MDTDLPTHEYSVEEFARRFCIGERTIYRLLGTGQLPAFRIGTQWRIPANFMERERDQVPA